MHICLYEHKIKILDTALIFYAVYGKIFTEKRGILDVKGFPAFFVTNVILVQFY